MWTWKDVAPIAVIQSREGAAVSNPGSASVSPVAGVSTAPPRALPPVSRAGALHKAVPPCVLQWLPTQLSVGLNLLQGTCWAPTSLGPPRRPSRHTCLQDALFRALNRQLLSGNVTLPSPNGCHTEVGMYTQQAGLICVRPGQPNPTAVRCSSTKETRLSGRPSTHQHKTPTPTRQVGNPTTELQEDRLAHLGIFQACLTVTHPQPPPSSKNA